MALLPVTPEQYPHLSVVEVLSEGGGVLKFFGAVVGDGGTCARCGAEAVTTVQGPQYGLAMAEEVELRGQWCGRCGGNEAEFSLVYPDGSPYSGI